MIIRSLMNSPLSTVLVKFPLRVVQEKQEGKSVSSPSRSILSPHDIIKNSEPYLDDVSWGIFPSNKIR